MTRPLLFSISLLILGIFIGIFVSKYLPVFSQPSASSAATGTLIATVMRSPTCAGTQRVGQVYEAPVTNETFKIIGPIGPTDDEVIQTVATDRDGKFTMSLTAGTYQLQSLTRGIGKNIGNPNFTIVAGKTTTQQFDIDTGIR